MGQFEGGRLAENLRHEDNTTTMAIRQISSEICNRDKQAVFVWSGITIQYWMVWELQNCQQRERLAGHTCQAELVIVSPTNDILGAGVSYHLKI